MFWRTRADFNSRVRSGDLIAEIEPSLFEAEVAQGFNLLPRTSAVDSSEATLTL